MYWPGNAGGSGEHTDQRLMQIAGEDFLVPRIGEQPDVSGQLAALDSGSDPVEAARQPAQQRHQLEHFLDSHVLQVHRSELSGDLAVRKALRLADDVEPGCQLSERPLQGRQGLEDHFDLGWHGHCLLLRAGLPDAAGPSRRDPMPWARHAGRYLR